METAVKAQRNLDAPLIPVASAVTPGDLSPLESDPAIGEGTTSADLGLPPFPFPPFHRCFLSWPEGCYQLRITNTPPTPPRHFFGNSYRVGTLRVNKTGAAYAVSGDTYRYSWFDLIAAGGIPSFGPTTIPIYPRSRYNSYLKVTAVNIPIAARGVCQIHLTVEEYDYTAPPAGSFDGTFPAVASRVMDIYLTPAAPPAGYTGAYFTGQVYIAGVLQTSLSVVLAWVNVNLRKATVEVHTMNGSAAPAAVGSDYFDTIYAKANWAVTVLTDPVAVPVPVTVPPTVSTNCWTSSALHGVMMALTDYAAVNLDAVWHMHVLMVQGKLGCGRGVMFDTINVPREGVASFSDDGYPVGDSPWFGTAANQMQKSVPRAFLRSCTHEITHGFNQIHQEQEGGGDNSIMTTTPSVANAIHAAAGTFPAGITLDFNDHVRHHLRHLPDPIVRPGGMTFTAAHNGVLVPSEDQNEQDNEVVEHPSLSLNLKAGKERVKIGEPLQLSWDLSNVGAGPVTAPNFVGVEHDFAELSVVKPDGKVQTVAPFVIVCDASQLTDLKPGETRSAEHQLFWSTQGFAFDSPGRHFVQLEVSWKAGDIKLGAKASVEILVDYPVTQRDNDVIAQMMHPEVGKFVALGGHAYHLKEAVARVRSVVRDHKEHDVAKRMAAFIDEKRIPG